MSVVPTLKWLPLIPASPAGLKKMAEPSAHGRAAATPARPMVQVFCSYTPNPCASSGPGGAETSEEAPASSNNANRRITCSPRGRIEVDGESGRDTVALPRIDRKSTRLNSSHLVISYAVFCLKKKNK